MSRNRTAIAIGAALLLLAACDAEVTEPLSPAVTAIADARVERDVYEGVWDLSDVYWGFECEGQESELIAMSGEIRHRVQFLRDVSGGIHVTGHQLSHKVRGIGTESGEEFRAKEIAHETYNNRGERMLGSFTGRVTLTGRDSGRGFIYTAMGHYVIDSNDELVVHRDSESWTCTL